MQHGVYAQSGGVTAVINASAAGVIEAWRSHHGVNLATNRLYAAENGILGILHEELIDIYQGSASDIASLRNTPGGAFGSCRYKLKDLNTGQLEYERLIEVFAAHQIGYFFYNGGNDSADTCLKVAQISGNLGYPIKAVHIPKTIDNDLVATDNCPGFGSVAKYIATSIREAGFDLASMCATSTKVFILEVMGRNAGWIAASAGIASDAAGAPPHIILFPELVFDEAKFLAKVAAVVKEYGYCIIAASEGIKNQHGDLLSKSSLVDAFGHAQLGGVASLLANLVANRLKLKCHYAIADYLQRSARHIASRIDIEQAYAVGAHGVNLALSGFNSVMSCVERVSTEPYAWKVGHADLTEVANKEKFMPRDFIDEEGFHITQKCRDYIEPLIQGEDYPTYHNGLPDYITFPRIKIAKKLAYFKI